MTNSNYLTPSWEEIHEFTKKTIEKIKKSDFYPDIVIALSRGGLIPARLLCDFLRIKNCLAIKVDHWGITATKNGKAKISHSLNMDLTGKKVLIVDDITDTGQSMELSKKHIEELNPSVVKTATLIHLKNSKHVPDFYGHERKDWAWFIFPWNYREDIITLIEKIGKGEKEVNQIKEELEKNFNIIIPVEELNEILEHMDYLKKIKTD